MCFCNFWRGATDQKVPGVPWAPVGKEIALEVITDVFEGKAVGNSRQAHHEVVFLGL